MSDRLSRFRTMLWKDKWLLLLCFILSFFAWQAIQRNIGFELPVPNIAVEIEVPEGWAVLDKSLDAVDARFLGSREDIRDLNREQLRVSIPVRVPKSGITMTIPMEAKFLRNNPTGARVVYFNPSEIEIRLDQEMEKLLPVKAAQDGSLPEGLEVATMVCKPATVRVRGAQQQLEKMESIHTEPIDLKNRQSSFRENVRIALPQGGRLQAEPDRVSVEVTLEEHSSESVLEKVPVRVLCSPGERRLIDVDPIVVRITIRGQQQRLDQLKPGELFAYVNCMELIENTGYDLPIIVDLPDGLQLVHMEPSAVRVEISNAN